MSYFNKKILFFLVLIFIKFMAFAAQPTQIEPWIDKDFPFNQLEFSAIQQAKGWARCSATVDMTAELFKVGGKESTAKRLHEFAIGASTAAMAPFFFELANKAKGLSKDELKRATDYAKAYSVMASKEWVESEKNMILSQRELASDDESWMNALATSFKYCFKKEALEVQEMHIDAVRMLTK